MSFTRTITALFISTWAALGAHSARADYTVSYNCNHGAAVLDHEYVSERGGNYHAYQFVIRDQGVIDYLARTGAINPNNIISGGHEALIYTFKYGKTFTEEGQLYRSPSRSDGWAYRITKKENGILFEGTGGVGGGGQWFFESCQYLDQTDQAKN
ncbi:MAG: hypothetical protein WCI18_17355 [Pseudomonadota bacterium]